MKEGRPSWTAELMALFRAIESTRPASTRLFDDPYAEAFLSPAFRVVALLCRLPLGRALVTRLIEVRWGGPLGSGVCRTRFIDDRVVDAARDGLEQIVILGAGFDSRAYRLPGLAGARVFEVDHPATQAVKRARLSDVPPHVVFVPIDFDREPLAEVMARAGFRGGERTFFLWEGVTNYLTADAVDQTVRWVASAGGPGSRFVFTYIHRGMLDGSLVFEGARAGRDTVGRMGEAFTFGLDPHDVPAYLAARGLTLVEDVAAPDYRERYLRPLGREMKIWEFYRVALAVAVS